jgi:hypothetical protein
MLVCTQLFKAVLILQSVGSEYSNRKDSLSMKQRYPNEVIAPGTVIISQVETVLIFKK